MPTSTARAPKRTKREIEKFRRMLEEKKAVLSAELAKARSAEEETTSFEEASVGRFAPARRERPSYWDQLPWA